MDAGADTSRAEFSAAMDRLAGLAGSERPHVSIAHDPLRLVASVRSVRPRLLSQAVAGWVIFDAIGQLACGGDRIRTTAAFDDWDAAGAVGDRARRSGSGDAQAWRAVELTRALLAVEPGAMLSAADKEGLPLSWFESAAVREATGWNEWQERPYVSQEAWDEFIDAIAERDDLLGMPSALDAAAELRRRAALAGYRLDASEPTPDAHAPRA